MYDLIKFRNVGFSRCSILRNYTNIDINIQLKRFGLFPQKDDLIEINYDEAFNIICQLLWKSIAYNIEIMSLDKAHKLASTYIDEFPKNETTYFTNAKWLNYYESEAFEWHSFTNSTFDGGIILVSNDVIGCFWVEEED